MATRKKKTAALKSFEEARAALREHLALNKEVRDLMDEHGITAKMERAAELKSAATTWAVKTETERIDLGKGIYARLRRDRYGGTWVATIDDLLNAPAGAVPLFDILRMKFKRKPQTLKRVWDAVTREVVDPDELQRVVLEGVVTADEIAPAFYEKEKAPFIIIYGE